MLPSWLRRPMIAFAGTRVGSRTYRHLLPRLDRLVGRLTNGRATFTRLALPTLVLVTTGRRSGVRREHPLLFVRAGDGYAVAGSNWGQRHHPAWSHNLLAEPDAAIRIGGTTTPVRAELLTGTDRERVYRRFERLSPNYPLYRRWADPREIRVFVLHPR
jgi:deazaflavin-dependent oxidoreductase (nitroreductase family)